MPPRDSIGGMETFLSVMRTRFACKRYRDAPIADRQLAGILEAGRLSPTSFGLEGWKFHVIRDRSLREAVTKACFDQESVATAPVTIAITALKALVYDPDGSFVAQRGKRFPGTLEEFVADYRGYYDFLESQGRLDCWSRAQCYIASANMMHAAACEGIQSCAIEGFDESQLSRILQIDTARWQVALAITFGYQDEQSRIKIREPIGELVEYH